MSDLKEREVQLKAYEEELKSKEVGLLVREGQLLERENAVNQQEEFEYLITPSDLLRRAGINPLLYENPKKLQLLIHLSDPTEDINISQLAVELDVHRTTIYRWKSDPQFIIDQNKLLDTALSAMYGMALRALYRNIHRGSDRALSIYFELTNRIRQGNTVTFNNLNVASDRSNEAIEAEIEELKRQLDEIDYCKG